jgi:hypothetical protein
VWPGLFTSQIMSKEGNWPADEILNQIQVTRKTPGAGGTVHFSMKVFMQDDKGIVEALQNGLYKKAALVPPSPWLDSNPPLTPTMKMRTTAVFDVAPGAGSEPLRLWAVWARYGEDWWYETRSADTRTIEVMPARHEAPLRAVAVAAVDRVGNLSAPVLWTAPQN